MQEVLKNPDGSYGIVISVPAKSDIETLYLSGSSNCFSEGNLSFRKEGREYSIVVDSIPGNFSYRIMKNQYYYLNHNGNMRYRRTNLKLPIWRPMHSHNGRVFSYKSQNFSLLVFLHPKGMEAKLRISGDIKVLGEMKIPSDYGLCYKIYSIMGSGEYNLDNGNGSETYRICNGKTNPGSGIIYHIFPDRFNSSRKILKIDGNNPRIKLGGDLMGIMDKLDYIKSLGIEFLYLNPIFKSHSYHRYDVDDYYSVDPELGTNEDLLDLTEKFHASGIKVILDMVFNHTSTHYYAFQDVLTRGAESDHLDWYIFHRPRYQIFSERYAPGKPGKKPSYETFMGVGIMPKLNHSNEKVVNFVRDVVRYYSENYKIGGLRYDVGNSIPESTVKLIREDTATMGKGFLHIGEAWCLAGDLVGESYYSSLTNYHIRKGIIDYVTGRIDMVEFYRRYVDEIVAYSQYLDNMMNILDSHDTVRILTTLMYREDLLKLAYAILMMLNGHPTIYYGDEVGLGGGNDPDCRRPFPWSKVDSSIHEFFMKLTKMRSVHPSFSNGILMISKADHVDMFVKVADGKSSILLVGDKGRREKVISSLGHSESLMLENNFSIIEVKTQDLLESDILSHKCKRE